MLLPRHAAALREEVALQAAAIQRHVAAAAAAQASAEEAGDAEALARLAISRGQ